VLVHPNIFHGEKLPSVNKYFYFFNKVKKIMCYGIRETKVILKVPRIRQTVMVASATKLHGIHYNFS